MGGQIAPMTWVDLVAKVDIKVNMWRSIQHLIADMPLFKQYWDTTTEAERELVIKHALAGDRTAILAWIQKHKETDIERRSLSELRKIDRSKNVRGYTQMDKIELIHVLNTKG